MDNLLYHHCRGFEHVQYGVVHAVKLSEALKNHTCTHFRADGKCFDCDTLEDSHWMECAYGFLAQHAGFWPIFVAVGKGLDILYMTGYQGQFQRLLVWSKKGNIYRAKGDIDNRVLFSFSNLDSEISFSDYHHYCWAMNSVKRTDHKDKPYEFVPLSNYEEKMILKKSWNKTKWLRKALKEDGSVQAVVPYLDLRRAERVMCRNQKTRKALIKMGFSPEKVIVKRLPVKGWW